MISCQEEVVGCATCAAHPWGRDARRSAFEFGLSCRSCGSRRVGGAVSRGTVPLPSVIRVVCHADRTRCATAGEMCREPCSVTHDCRASRCVGLAPHGPRFTSSRAQPKPWWIGSRSPRAVVPWEWSDAVSPPWKEPRCEAPRPLAGFWLAFLVPWRKRQTSSPKQAKVKQFGVSSSLAHVVPRSVAHDAISLFVLLVRERESRGCRAHRKVRRSRIRRGLVGAAREEPPATCGSG